MQLPVGLTAAAFMTLMVSVGFAQRPANTPICDYYTTALLKTNNATNQLTLLTLVVNTVVIGNYTKPNVGISVPGILAKGKINGTDVNLLPFFDGTLASTNLGGSSGASLNFLDDGGAAPLKLNKPSNGNVNSNQYRLLTHLYEFFGLLLGCTLVGQNGYPAYSGKTSMYDVHKFMDLTPAQLNYFITQVGLSAASFGVATEDVTAVGTALSKLFGSRCEPPSIIIPKSSAGATSAELQSICIDQSCPLSLNATCPAYDAAVKPSAASSSSSSSASSSGTSTSSSTSGAAKPTTSTAGVTSTTSQISGQLALMTLMAGFMAVFIL